MIEPNRRCRSSGRVGRWVRTGVALLLAIWWADQLHGQAAQHALDNFRSTQALELRQQLVIDGYQEDLVPIRWIAASPEGFVYVAQEQDGRVLVFDSTGDRRASIGRRGEGPGEVQNLMLAGFVADTFWFYDGPQRRLNFVSPEFEVSRFTRWPPPESGLPQLDALPERITFALVFFQGLLADRTVAAALFRPSVLPPDAPEGAAFYGVVGADGEIRHLVGHVPPGPPPVLRDDGWLTYNTVPAEVEGHFAVSPDGRRSALVVATMVGQEAGRFEGVITGLRGDTILSVAGKAPLPIRGIVVGWDHSLWLRTEGENEAHYYVINSSGELQGRIDLPLNVRVQVVDAENVWGVMADEFDVQSVVRYAHFR